MAQHRAPSRRPERATLLAALCSLVLAGLIALSLGTAGTQVTDCYTNPDVRGQWC